MANPQSSERPDLQDLVAYMQGRGSETLRAQVLKRLDEDEEYLELMMDLVPMLREAGELADPDAAPAPSPSPMQTLVDAPLPAVEDALPAGMAGMPVMPGKVVALPSRSAGRPRAAYAALVALIPCAVAIWIATRPHLPLPVALSGELGTVVSVKVAEDTTPWGDSAMRGGAADLCGSDPSACFDAGAQMIDLQVALRDKSEPLARRRLANLGNSLGKGTFERYFPGLVAKPDWPPFELDYMEKQVAAGYANLREDLEVTGEFDEGACLRAAFLAAAANDKQFFESRRARKLCFELVGEESWKPDASVLGELYYKTRSDLSDLP